MEIIGNAQNGQAGVAYSATFSGAGGASPYTFTDGGLPSGWTFTSGVLAAASPVAGTYLIEVTMEDSARNVPVTQTYRITINA
jgi:hypothetical protein